MNINFNSEYVTIYYYEKHLKDDEKNIAQLGRKESEKTILQAVIEKGNIDILKLMLAFPAIDINMYSNYTDFYLWKNPEENDDERMHVFKVPKKKAPLHFSVEKKNISIINLLLQQESIDVNITDERDRKPIDYTKDDQIIKLFSEFGK